MLVRSATKYGPVKTYHILFIASGAFHVAKPSDLLPELQGRLPIRVELKGLTEADFVHILTDTEASLRSEEHTSELQSLMRISYAVFCLKKQQKPNTQTHYLNI